MIVKNRPLKKKYVKELQDVKISEEIEYHFIKQENMKIFSDVSEESERAASVAKAIIKKSELGQALFYMVEHVK